MQRGCRCDLGLAATSAGSLIGNRRLPGTEMPPDVSCTDWYASAAGPGRQGMMLATDAAPQQAGVLNPHPCCSACSHASQSPATSFRYAMSPPAGVCLAGGGAGVVLPGRAPGCRSCARRNVLIQVEQVAWVVAALDLLQPVVSAAVVVAGARLVVGRGEVGVPAGP